MAGELSTVLVRLTADASDFISNIEKSALSMTTFAEAAMAMTTAGVAVTGALTAMVQSATKYEQEIDNMNARTGIATTTLSSLSVAADAQGVSLNSLQVAMRKLGQEVEDSLLSPYSKAATVFADLGVHVTDSSGHVKDFNTLLPELSDALNGIQDPMLRAGLASDVFGRSSMALLPVLASGSGAMQQWADIAEKTGVMVTQAQADQGKAFQVMEQIAEDAFKGLEIAISSQLAPAFMSLLNTITTFLESMTSFVKTFPEATTAVLELGVALIGLGVLTAVVAGVIALVGVFPALIVEAGAVVGVITGLTTVFYAFKDIGMEVVQIVGTYLATSMLSMLNTAEATAKAFGLTGLAGNIDEARTKIVDATDKFSTWYSEQAVSGNTMVSTQSKVEALVDSLNKSGQASDTAALETTKHVAAVTQLYQAVTGTTDQGQILTEVIERLIAAHKGDFDIVTALSPQLLKYGEEQTALGGTINTLVQYYYDLALARKIDSDTTEKQWDLAVAIGLATENLAAKTKEYVLSLNDQNNSIKLASGLWDAYQTAIDKAINEEQSKLDDSVKTQIKQIQDIIAADTEGSQKRADLANGLAELQKSLQTEVAAHQQTILDMMSAQEAGYDADTLANLKGLSDEQVRRIQELQGAIDNMQKQSSVATDAYWKHFYTSAQEAMQNMEFAMADAMGSLSTGIASSLAHDIVTWNNWGDSLTKLSQDVSQKMLTAFLDGLLNPLTNALREGGKEIADSLGSLFGGGGGGGGGLGSIFGTIFSFLGFLEEGTPYVPQTGLAVVHQGERVITAADNAKLAAGGLIAVNGGIGGPVSTSNSGYAGGGNMDDTNNLLAAILNAVRQGSTIQVGSQVLGQAVSAALRGMTLTAGVATNVSR